MEQRKPQFQYHGLMDSWTHGLVLQRSGPGVRPSNDTDRWPEIADRNRKLVLKKMAAGCSRLSCSGTYESQCFLRTKGTPWLYTSPYDKTQWRPCSVMPSESCSLGPYIMPSTDRLVAYAHIGLCVQNKVDWTADNTVNSVAFNLLKIFEAALLTNCIRVIPTWYNLV